MRCLVLAVASSFLFSADAQAEVRLPTFFSDGMVLQRDAEVPVWGTAEPGADVTVSLDDAMQAARADDAGKWRVTFAPQAAGGPHVLRVREATGEPIEVRDVQFGEVWIASGQSNMHWTFSNDIFDKERELDAANDPLLRQFTVAKARAFVRKTEVNEPLHDAVGKWRGSSRAELLADGEDGDSALAFFFGRALRKELNVPVGIYNASVGGSAIDPWSPGGSLFNKMIHPLGPLEVRGVIWYQGEANINAAGVGYTEQMKHLITSWRTLFRKPELPFYYVQLAPFIHSTRANSKAPTHALPGLWEAQTAVLAAVPHTGMVVVTDTVDDVTNIHPPKKQAVGARLAAWALAKTYGRSDVAFSGPMFAAATKEGDAMRVRFAHVDGGLKSRDGRPLSHFVLAGDDGQFHPAEATIDGDTVVVRSAAVPKPVDVRFAWDELARPNLMNAAGLPANSFRSDRRPLGE